MNKHNFFEQVYALVGMIPQGKVMTYGQIAEVLHSPYSARVVGFAMSGAPEERGLPCHRVVNRKGEMAPGLIFGGASRQRALLLAEGAAFKDDGRVDLAQSLWRPDMAPAGDKVEDFF